MARGSTKPDSREPSTLLGNADPSRGAGMRVAVAIEEPGTQPGHPGDHDEQQRPPEEGHHRPKLSPFPAGVAALVQNPVSE
jgi:hypothetical protein